MSGHNDEGNSVLPFPTEGGAPVQAAQPPTPEHVAKSIAGMWRMKAANMRQVADRLEALAAKIEGDHEIAKVLYEIDMIRQVQC